MAKYFRPRLRGAARLLADLTRDACGSVPLAGAGRARPPSTWPRPPRHRVPENGARVGAGDRQCRDDSSSIGLGAPGAGAGAAGQAYRYALPPSILLLALSTGIMLKYPWWKEISGPYPTWEGPKVTGSGVLEH